MKEKKHLPMFGVDYLTDNNFVLQPEHSDSQLMVYRNETKLLIIDKDNTYGSLHLIKNNKKSKREFNQLLKNIKENFYCFSKNNNDECKMTETDKEKRERQEKELEERHQVFLQKNRL